MSSNIMDMEIAGTENSIPDYIPQSVANNQNATGLYQQIGIGINHQVMED